MGDFRAQVAAVKTGEKRFLEMLRKYGRDHVLGSIDAIMDQSEVIARERVRAIPDGIYEAESFMDDDGISVGAGIPIRVRVEVKGDRMTVDLTEVSKQVGGFYNSGETAGRSSCQVAFKCLTSPLDMPINDGQFRALDIVLPPGRVVSAVKPAAMRMWMTYPMTVVDTIFKALAPENQEQAKRLKETFAHSETIVTAVVIREGVAIQWIQRQETDHQADAIGQSEQHNSQR